MKDIKQYLDNKNEKYNMKFYSIGKYCQTKNFNFYFIVIKLSAFKKMSDIYTNTLLVKIDIKSNQIVSFCKIASESNMNANTNDNARIFNNFTCIFKNKILVEDVQSHGACLNFAINLPNTKQYSLLKISKNENVEITTLASR